MGESSHGEPKKSRLFATLSGKKGVDRNRPGQLDKLEEMYARLLRLKEVKEGLKNVFQQVRIMVIGRAGAGKSTLIRLMVGDSDGPRTISNAKAGNQDIDREWRSTDPDLPVIFHDSNGMDVRGQERLTTIEEFLQKRQKKEVFAERIHFIWYVINGTDNRFLDDGKALELVTCYKIPILVIITHSDHDAFVREVVTPRALRELLSRIADPEFNEEKQLIRVGNHVRQKKNGELIRIRVDLTALQKLSQATKRLIDKKLRYTWAAVQAVNTHDKMDASAKLIVHYKQTMLVTSVANAIPFVEPTKLAVVLAKILKSLCTIWRVPPNFESALFKYVAMSEGAKGVCGSLLKSLCAAAGLVVTITATALTGGTAFPAILGLLVGSGVADTRASMSVLICYSSVILGSILYAKTMQAPGSSWDAHKPVDDYRVLCNEFATSRYENNLTNLMTKCHSTWDTVWQKKKQKVLIKAAIFECFQEFFLKRPNSLYSVMKSSESVQFSKVEKVLESIASFQSKGSGTDSGYPDDSTIDSFQVDSSSSDQDDLDDSSIDDKW